jgi:hypothetical protein
MRKGEVKTLSPISHRHAIELHAATCELAAVTVCRAR